MKFYIRGEGIRLVRDAETLEEALIDFVEEVGRPNGIVLVSEQGFDIHDDDIVVSADALNAILNPTTKEA